jgi:hypothetical protein
MAASPLTYPTGDFVPFTKILSSEVNGKFTAISTLLNTTKLSDTNLQDQGISWTKLTLQAVSKVAVTDTIGQLTVVTSLSTVLGGLGFSYTPTSVDAAKVMQVNAAGSALTLDTTPVSPSIKMYQWNHFL